jgi:archaellum biogenesis ATPase FlaH
MLSISYILKPAEPVGKLKGLKSISYVTTNRQAISSLKGMKSISYMVEQGGSAQLIKMYSCPSGGT